MQWVQAMPRPNINYPKGQHPGRASSIQGVRVQPAPKPIVLPYVPPGGADDFALEPPPDKQARQRSRRIEELHQSYFMHVINSCLEPGPLADGFLVAMPGFPGADMIAQVANENAAGAKVGAARKRTGVRRGYPDITIDVGQKNGDGNIWLYLGARIELKQPQGVLSNVSDHQKAWHERLTNNGYKVAVCFGCDEALLFTHQYLGWQKPYPLSVALPAGWR